MRYTTRIIEERPDPHSGNGELNDLLVQLQNTTPLGMKTVEAKAKPCGCPHCIQRRALIKRMENP